jgi:hypothetical protein
VADIDTPTSELDSVVALLDAQGLVVGFDDNDQDGLLDDSLMTVTIPADGDYHMVVVGSFSFPDDVVDPASGPGRARTR